MSSVQLNVKLSCVIWEDEDTGVYVSKCPSLDIYSQGESEGQAFEAIKSAVKMYLHAAYENQQTGPDSKA
ncbi:MAG: hypothetical protein L0Y56_19105 [Nitrospira sp.]|nr:hypothetical protein [Nitrospira sp.]